MRKLTILLFLLIGSVVQGQSKLKEDRYIGKYCEGTGDADFLRLIDESFAFFRPITVERKAGINQFYEKSALSMYQGFGNRMAGYAVKGNVQQKRVAALFSGAQMTVSQTGLCQKIVFEFEKTPRESGFKMDGYWIWCGSMIKVGSTYHLFASRWNKNGDFPEGYRQNSEIVRATSKSALGPFKFEEVVIGERDSSYWDSNMAHNPTIHKIGNEYVLFYIGSDFKTFSIPSKSLLRQIGYASSRSITGPWKRSDEPIIKAESNNPAILPEGSKIKLFYRDAQLKVILAESDHYNGIYTTVNDNLWPDCKLEDFYAFKADNQYHLICEDNVGKVSGHERWGVHLVSVDGEKNWKEYDPVVVYNHDILFTDNTILKCTRRERPQLFIENGMIAYLITAVYDGKNTWSQPVKLKRPIKIN